MAVTSEIFDVEQQAPPVPSKPFLWKDGEIIWLRCTNGGDICVKPGPGAHGWFALGACTGAITPDTAAWARRLPSDKAVMLQNAK